MAPQIPVVIPFVKMVVPESWALYNYVPCATFKDLAAKQQPFDLKDFISKDTIENVSLRSEIEKKENVDQVEKEPKVETELKTSPKTDNKEVEAMFEEMVTALGKLSIQYDEPMEIDEDEIFYSDGEYPEEIFGDDFIPIDPEDGEPVFDQDRELVYRRYYEHDFEEEILRDGDEFFNQAGQLVFFLDFGIEVDGYDSGYDASYDSDDEYEDDFEVINE
ncbi:135L [Cherax quadricarinatus iridovirus]|uniref:Transcription factor Iwr1 domain-containing protein n=1 Tax=Shrimp hemocyte iridescent virus TaxID=2039780 RepID=A0A291B0M0_9VIRU|nr:135L [Cherax quadricarinatus iridovirus]YP_010084773.1 hypothetical protein KM509_gp021 [Shrimp hemocyte iridescent virus]UPA43282.1 hypothetical protein 4TH000008 [Iridovirus CN01]ASZ85115.1 135L [Cherax quadricarinatus iridovirus]ATE87030.1 hypothetical protein [Shrimp hemocyte iridescent virus]UPA43517.1 hypothetical protein 3TG000084 [Iridovirus CN01]UPA43714.1 hypothetical protein 1DG000122 [Iridovirus CN01]